MTRLLVALVGLMLLNVSAGAECPSGPLEDDFARSTVVFAGQATARSVILTNGFTGRETLTTFQVEEQWKGAAKAAVIVRTCGGVLNGTDISCGETVRFDVGSKYVVFAAGEPLTTSACSPSRRFDQADRTLRWLSTKPAYKLPSKVIEPSAR